MNSFSFVLGTSYKTPECSGEYNDDGKTAWRIRIITPISHGVFPVKFARKKDAQAGLNGLLKYVDMYNLSEDDIRTELRKLGPKRVREIICNEMAW